MEQNTKAGAGATAKIDKHGNPHGTIYTQEGIAMHEGKETGKNLPQPTEGMAVMYEENGSIFALPEKHQEVLANFRMNLKGLEVAISGGRQKVETMQAMLAEADADDKPVFEKTINSQLIAMESNSKLHAAMMDEKKEFEYKLITPAQRRDEREYNEVMEKIATLNVRKIELENKRKAYGIGKNEAIDKKVAEKNEPKVATEDQKANYEKLLALHTTQGAVVVALVKEGKTNAEIANLIGINPANVPGPKNKWLRGEQAKAEGWFLDEVTGRVSKK